MPSVSYVTLDNDLRQLPRHEIDVFAAKLRGSVLVRGESSAYEEARTIWNATVDRHPALIVRCADEADVQAAVRFAAARRMLVSVKGGGHHIAGNAIVEGGLTIDLSGLRSVTIDAAARTAHVAPGALWDPLESTCRHASLSIL